MPILIQRESMQAGGWLGSIAPQDLKSGTYFGQMQLRGSILTIKDASTTQSGYMSFGTSMVTIPTSPTTGTGIYIDYSGIYGLVGGVAVFTLDAATGNITATGTINATGGTIGGFVIGSDYIRDVANSFGLASTVTGGDDVRFWAGNTFANRATAPLRAYESGAFVATSATISGTITATAGNIGGWDITATDIRNAADTVMLRGAGNLAFGATPPTAANAGTGLFLDDTGLYGLASNTAQFYWTAADGKGVAGAGVVTLDVDGITINDANVTAANIKWKSGSDYTAQMGTYSTAGEAKLTLSLNEALSFNSGRFHLNVFEVGGSSAEFRARADTSDGAYFTFSGSLADIIGVKIGSHNLPLAMLDVRGSLLVDSIASPAQITGDQNDYSPTGLSGAFMLRLSSDAARNITGLAAQASGRIIAVCNVGAQNIVLVDASGASVAANQFALNGNQTLAGDESCILQYDGTSACWRMLARS